MIVYPGIITLCSGRTTRRLAAGRMRPCRPLNGPARGGGGGRAGQALSGGALLVRAYVLFHGWRLGPLQGWERRPRPSPCSLPSEQAPSSPSCHLRKWWGRGEPGRSHRFTGDRPCRPAHRPSVPCAGSFLCRGSTRIGKGPQQPRTGCRGSGEGAIRAGSQGERQGGSVDRGMCRYVSYYRERGKGDSSLFGAQMHLRYSRCSSPRWRK